ncbi:sensor histidine kinase [Paenibacillus bovis]|uniref:histidine kinase n=1 Tax=Paenibacillus bovis TaxID=1616788 RepID=A0A172ZH02_9BACL|nr:HAMP domain-containing sensor histidine kinase [Paenibacillus bovis]ANF96809.1 two-component sensor histidine kinase [Paenibacillus bovis]
MKLRTKIHLYSSVLFALLFLTTNLIVYIVFSTMTLQQQQSRIESQTNKTADNMRQSSVDTPAADLLRAYVPVEGMIWIVRETGSNTLLVTSADQQQLAKRPVQYLQERTAEIITYEQQRYVFVSVPVIWNDGQVINIQITESLRQTGEYLRALRIVLLIVTGLAMIPVFLSGHVLGRIIIRPIAAITATMRDIRRSGQFQRLTMPSASSDELYEMSATFNSMMDLLESNYDKQKQFVSNASHELRTPLTIIESYASLLKRRGMDRPELFAESVEAIHSEAVRMKEMTEQLLMLARHEEQWNLTVEPVDLLEQAQQLAREFDTAYHRRIEIRVDPQLEQQPDLLSVQTDAGKLRQMMFILLDNARKYSVDDITIELSLDHTPRQQGTSGKRQHTAAVTSNRCIKIIDYGIGIPTAELDKVFDRFYRVDEARVRQDTGGSGLGLTLARRIAEALGASIRLESVAGQGTSAILTLPEAPTSMPSFSANSN